MDDQVFLLRRRLTEFRDEALDFIARVESELPKEVEYGTRDSILGVRVKGPDVWEDLESERQGEAEELRRRVRELVADIATLAQQSILLDESDLRRLSHNGKRMGAALRFRLFKHWGVYVHHDEDIVLGVDPPGQSEDDLISPEEARIIIKDACTQTLELTDFLSARKERLASSLATSEAQPVLSYRRNTAFVMMWINPERAELDDVRDVVREVFGEFGIQAVRSDEIEHSEGITERIMEEIRTSEFLFADLTGERPSVYYEIGYAHALGKSVILYHKKGEKIHFDLAYRNCPEYKNLGDLRKKLRKRLTEMTNRTPAQGGDGSE